MPGFFFFFFFFMCVFACLYTCTPCESVVPTEVRKGRQTPGTGVTFEVLGYLVGAET